jgi:hypothetical protein
MHVIPTSRREIIPTPRSSSSSVSTGPVITTTYKVSADGGSRVREGSRSRRSTLTDSTTRPYIPTIVTTSPRHKPVIHSAGGRPTSPLKDLHRSSQEDYYAVPATSRHKHHHHRYSDTMDNADMKRLSRERDSSRVRMSGPREPAYAAQRTQPRYTGAVPRRHADTVAEDYGDNGYGYTNPRDLVQYDLNTNEAPRHHKRRESFGKDVPRARPNSITGYSDLAPARSFDARERGPPPTTRGFDRIPIRGHPAERDQARMSIPMMDPIARPASVNRPRPVEPMYDQEARRESIQRPASVNRPRVEPAFEPELRRNSSRNSSRRPVSLYHDREPRQSQREEYYEARDEEPRRRSEKALRHERYDDDRRSDRPERPERPERAEKRDEEKKDHKARDVLTTGLSLAGAALGVKAFKDAATSDKEERKEEHKDERDERDEPRRRRDYDDESRRRHDHRDDREPETVVREERRSSRDHEREHGPPEPAIDLSGRDPRERLPSPKERLPSPRERLPFRDERDGEPERLRRSRPDISIATGEAAAGSSDGSIEPDESTPRRRRRESGAPAFNPKDTMDLVALKAALNSKDAETASAHNPARTPRESMSKGSLDLAKVRSDLDEDQKSPRIVTPPLSAGAQAPVKSILRAPREKFPEDPAPIREGVAPLKDAKKDGVPPDARWTKISRKLVNPEALEAGKERYEAREDFVIVLRVLSRDEVQGYAEVTERIRGTFNPVFFRDGQLTSSSCTRGSRGGRRARCPATSTQRSSRAP